MTIIVGYIPTPEGSAAVDVAISEAKLRAAKVVVVNTGRDGNYSDATFASGPDLDALEQQLTKEGIEHEISQPTSGLSAADAILSAAESGAAQLIVIGIRRRSPIGKLVTGSTAQQILLDAPCAVLAVKSAR